MIAGSAFLGAWKNRSGDITGCAAWGNVYSKADGKWQAVCINTLKEL